MTNYKYRVHKIEVIEESNIEAESRDEALDTIYDGIWNNYTDADGRFEVEWLDGEAD